MITRHVTVELIVQTEKPKAIQGLNRRIHRLDSNPGIRILRVSWVPYEPALAPERRSVKG